MIIENTGKQSQDLQRVNYIEVPDETGLGGTLEYVKLLDGEFCSQEYDVGPFQYISIPSGEHRADCQDRYCNCNTIIVVGLIYSYPAGEKITFLHNYGSGREEPWKLWFPKHYVSIHLAIDLRNESATETHRRIGVDSFCFTLSDNTQHSTSKTVSYGIEDAVKLPLPNIYASGFTCLNPVDLPHYPGVHLVQFSAEDVDYGYSTIWSSVWNDDLSPNWDDHDMELATKLYTQLNGDNLDPLPMGDPRVTCHECHEEFEGNDTWDWHRVEHRYSLDNPNNISVSDAFHKNVHERSLGEEDIRRYSSRFTSETSAFIFLSLLNEETIKMVPLKAWGRVNFADMIRGRRTSATESVMRRGHVEYVYRYINASGGVDRSAFSDLPSKFRL